MEPNNLTLRTTSVTDPDSYEVQLPSFGTHGYHLNTLDFSMLCKQFIYLTMLAQHPGIM